MKGFSVAVPFRPGLVNAAIATAVLWLSACTGAGQFSGTAMCEAAGGHYAGSTCAPESSPGELLAQQWCETHGGVYLGGEERCAFGMGR